MRARRATVGWTGYPRPACEMIGIVTKLQAPVSFSPSVGYISRSTPDVPRSLSALSLAGLRRRILVVAAVQRRADREIVVQLTLDPAAQAEGERRRGDGVCGARSRPNVWQVMSEAHSRRHCSRQAQA
jgi:hypothetical protein